MMLKHQADFLRTLFLILIATQAGFFSNKFLPGKKSQTPAGHEPWTSAMSGQMLFFEVCLQLLKLPLKL